MSNPFQSDVSQIYSVYMDLKNPIIVGLTQ